MESTITLASKDTCTGCGACKAICHRNAIAFKNDSEGFPFPTIMEDKCIQCGMCMKTCHVLDAPKTEKIKEAYAVQVKDKELLMESTSGGVFGVFSKLIFSMGGVVYGCIWDDEYNAVFTRAENEIQLKPMHGSKYVWSWAGDVFRSVQEDLKHGTMVLFVGLPCQIAGLQSFLGQGYQNLLTIDFLCSGSPSPMALKSYLDTICDRADLVNLNLKFRDKDPHGVGVHITYSGKKNKGRRLGQHITNSYYYSFYTRLIDRICCYHCQYGSDERVADLTMGDYWGVDNFHNDMNVRDGISALLINTEKGINFFNNIRRDIVAIPTKEENIARANNLSIGKLKQYTKPKNREAFLETIASSGWRVAERKYLYNLSRLKRIVKANIPDKFIRLIKKLIG